MKYVARSGSTDLRADSHASGRILLEGKELLCRGSSDNIITVVGPTGNRFKAFVSSDSSGTVYVSIDNYRITLQVMRESVSAAYTILSARKLAGARIVLAIKAPMPGMVRKMLVQVGDVIKAGSVVAILEAMKMENEVRASHAGKISRVSVAPGSSVEKGRTLVELEEV